MQKGKKSPQARTISVLLFEDFSNHCLANGVEPFRAANIIAGRALYSWRYFSIPGGRVSSSSGLPVETEEWKVARPGGDCLFIMPSYGYRGFATPETGRILRAAAGRFRLMAGFDTGAWLLASAGLLNGRRATIHWDEITAFAETFPDTGVVEDRFVLEEDMGTCGGASTSLDLALELIRREQGAMFALEVAANFMYGDKPDPPDGNRRYSSDALVRSAAALMRRNMEAPLPVADLAQQLGQDRKTLERRIKASTGRSPASVCRTIRLREARRLVQQTTLGIAEIAQRCGYQDASAMTRAYRLEFGVPPRDHRAS